MSTKGVKKGNLLAFMPKNMYFCLCKTVLTVMKCSEFSHVSPTYDSSTISSDANLKNNQTSYNEEVISENTEFTDYFDM